MTKFVRYAISGTTAYGVLEDNTIQELNGNFLDGAQPTGQKVSLNDVQLLAPCQPSKALAIGLNYKSHIGGRPAPSYPGIFLKAPTCIIGPGVPIVFPPEATNVHYEAELVVVIGKKTSRITREQAPLHIFGVTAGNDVSEREWQKNDLQWFRAKGSDTFGPLGPAIVQGLNYNDLLVESRVNGEVRQSQRTSDLIFDVDTLVSYISTFVTLLPGDVIYTGTHGKTRAMQSGDVVEIEVEGVGILRNPIA